MMKTSLLLLTLLVLISPSVHAQDSAVHPLLTNTFTLTGGVFIPEKEFKLRVNGQIPGKNIDFGDVFKASQSQSTGALGVRWRFGEKWSVIGQYWSVNDTGKATLDKRVEWRDVVFEEGTFARGEVGIDVTRLLFGRLFSASPNHEFGLGIGLHWLELSAAIEGQVLSNMGDSSLYKDSVSAGAPLPNIGGWYTWALSPKWALVGRMDWLSASVGEYSGSLVNASAGVEWAVFRNFGLGASYNFFELDVDVKKSDWNGSATITQHGPFLSLSATW